jgi:hypothetical protein
VLVEFSVPGRAGEHVSLLVGRRRQLVEPLLRDVDLALGGARVDLLEAVGGRLDEPRVGERAEEGLPGEADHLAARAVGVDGKDAHDAVGDLGRCGSGGRGGRGGSRGDGAEGAGERRGEVEREAAQGARRDRHGCLVGFEWEIWGEEVRWGPGGDWEGVGGRVGGGEGLRA